MKKLFCVYNDYEGLRHFVAFCIVQNDVWFRINIREHYNMLMGKKLSVWC
jgi:hypothetical protein